MTSPLFPLRLAFAFLVASLATGCSSLNLQRPTAQVNGMSVADVNARGFTMNFDVAVTNPNAVTLPLAAADYQLGVGGTKLLDGKTKPQASLPARESRSITLPVAVTFENLLSAERAIATSGGNVPYDLTAGLTFDTGVPVLGQMRVPLSYSGTLPLRDVLKNPSALMSSDAAKHLAKLLLGSFFTR